MAQSNWISVSKRIEAADFSRSNIMYPRMPKGVERKLAELSDAARRQPKQRLSKLCRLMGSPEILMYARDIVVWHDTIGDPTIADAILDRLVNRAHRIELKGPSLRKKRGNDDE